MSRRNWIIVSGASAATILYAVCAASWFANYHLSHAHLRDDASAEYQDTAASAIEHRCGLGPLLWDAECASKITQAAQREKREKTNLQAQQDMAEIVALLGLPGLIISGFGLWALVWTFRETRKLTAIQSRAYVLTEMHSVTRIPSVDNDGMFQIHVSVEIANSGQTPAFDVAVSATIGWFELKEVDDWQPKAPLVGRGVIGPGKSRSINQHIEVNYSNEDIARHADLERTLYARGVVQYRDFEDQWWEHTFYHRLKEPMRIANEGVGKKVDFAMTPLTSYNGLRKIGKPE